MRGCWVKSWTSTNVNLIGLGLGACSDAALKDQASITNGGVSQTNKTDTQPGSKTHVNNLSAFFDITYLDFNSAEFSAKIRMVLGRAVNKFLTDLSTRVVNSAYADERGARGNNLAFGCLRVSAAADYILAIGFDDLTVHFVSFGQKKPLLKGSNQEAWSKKRRVKINV